MVAGLSLNNYAAQCGSLMALNDVMNASVLASPTLYFGGGDSGAGGFGINSFNAGYFNRPVFAGGWGVPMYNPCMYGYTNPAQMYMLGNNIGATVGGLAGGVLKGAGNAISGLFNCVC